MKLLLTTLLLVFSTVVLANGKQSEDIRTMKSFVETCPEQYLTYIDKSEGGPGAYCNCPDENIRYIDKSEGGVGFICLEE